MPPEPFTQKPRPRSPYRFSEPLLPPQPLAPGAMDADGVHIRTCPLCEAMCGLAWRWGEDGRVARIRADPEDVWSQGDLCRKGPAVAELHEDPSRLRRPLVKRGGEHVEAPWEEAFEEAWRLPRPVVQEHGLEAVTPYIDNLNAQSKQDAAPNNPRFNITSSLRTNRAARE